MFGRKPHSTFRWLAAVLAALSLLAASCGDDDDDDGGTGDGQASGAGGDCGNELKLGILVPLTGELGDFGRIWQNAMELAVEQINDSGALPEGWSVSSIVGDEKTDPEEGLRAAQSMISDGVSAIIGPTSGPIVAMVDLAADEQTPILSEAAGTINLNELGGEWVYRTVASDLSDGLATALWFAEKGYERIGMLVQQEESTTSPAAVLKQRVEEGGAEVVAEVRYNPGQGSYQAELQQVLDRDPDVIFLAGGQESGVTILREANQAGYDGDILVTADMVVPEVIEAVGAEDMEGVQGETSEADVTLPTYEEFAAAYQAKYDEEPGLFTANAFDAVNLVALAAVASESTCGADINSELRNVAAEGTEVNNFADGAAALANGQDIDYFGASGPVDFDESGTVAGSYSIYEVQGGEWQPIEFLSAEELQAAEQE